MNFITIFFTSLSLLLQRKNGHFRTTGTIRENILQNCPSADSKMLKKKDRGTFDGISTKSISIIKSLIFFYYYLSSKNERVLENFH